MIIVRSNVVVGPPPPPPPPPPVIHQEYGFGMQLIDSNNVAWDLAAGPVFALSGASGFGSPDVEHWWRAPAAIDGSFHQGLRIPSREVTLPLEVTGGTPADWLATDQELWRGLNPRGECRLVVTTPEATQRWLTMRLTGGGDVEVEEDPLLRGRSQYPLTFTAGDPYWRGPLVRQGFETTTGPADLFPGPPFNIGVSSAIGSGTVTNPGDEPGWPIWTIEGPYATATVGVGASIVTLSTPIAAGQRRIINMDPRYNSITDQNGVRRWSEATAATFEPIPPGVDVPLNMGVTASTTDTKIELSFSPRYRRAW